MINGSERTTALVLLAAALLMIAPTGDVTVGGQEAGLASTTAMDEGRRLFRKETFGGNGRTCETCHSRNSGTISPAEVQERLKKDPNDPLFLHDGLDDGLFGTSRIAEHATIRVELPLPPNIRIAEDPSATSVVLFRGIPGTINTQALDPAFMYDLRAGTLEDQALGAIRDHTQNRWSRRRRSWN